MDKINEYISDALFYKGAFLAMVIMFVSKEKTSRKDTLLRVTLVALFAGQSGEIVQYYLGWGDQFHDFAQAAGILTIWIAVGILRCAFIGRCRTELVHLVGLFIATVKAGRGKK